MHWPLILQKKIIFSRLMNTYVSKIFYKIEEKYIFFYFLVTTKMHLPPYPFKQENFI